MLKYLRKRYKPIYVVQTKATDVLYQKMHAYNKEAKEILAYLVKETKERNPNSPALKQLYQMMDKADNIVIDCAHKLAPYQSPKLESIEVRNKVEHKFIIRAPQKITSVEEWTKITGAEQLKQDNFDKKQSVITPPAPSIHDFDTDDDEIETLKRLN